MLHQLRSILQSSNLCKDALSKKSIDKLKVVIDFSSPNIAKTFHMGNLRGTLLGNFIQRIYRCAGHEVISINYLGTGGNNLPCWVPTGVF
uniref:Probable arginine--tRNA ligase, mitochondrial n=1 Tax=Ditylenchus dipsaci TaxID=166011 RepID=A0A915CP69_9BILA